MKLPRQINCAEPKKLFSPIATSSIAGTDKLRPTTDRRRTTRPFFPASRFPVYRQKRRPDRTTVDSYLTTSADKTDAELRARIAELKKELVGHGQACPLCGLGPNAEKIEKGHMKDEINFLSNQLNSRRAAKSSAEEDTRKPVLLRNTATEQPAEDSGATGNAIPNKP